MSLLLRHRRPFLFKYPPLFSQIAARPLSDLSSKPAQTSDPKSNLSARLSFVFDQIDAIDNRTSEKFDALQRIRQWRESRNRGVNPEDSKGPDTNEEELKGPDANLLVKRKEVEVVHPWPEWIELMERLGQQNYFDHRRVSEDRVAESVGIDLSEVKEEVGFDFSRDWTTVRNACMNFGKDRFDILRSLSKKDIQILVGHGCPSMDTKVVFSAKLLRKYTHLDEGDVCSSCNLRNSCSRGYILTLKEDEARTLDVMRVLLTYGFEHVNGAVENKPLMQMKSVKTVVRKLLHEIVKLSAVPIDPNLPPPVIKKPPPKVKQPPTPPKKRVGRDDVEMKKGDWLCPKCDFMNFAKNTVCLQCDAKRPKRQLLPGEWECPQCNFLNYRRNMACFHCDAKRPPDEFTENQFQAKQPGPRMRMDRAARVQDVSNTWNFDFDDNESDGADVAAFEFADSKKAGNGSDLDDDLPHGRISESFEDDTRNTRKIPRARERGRHFSDDNERKSTSRSDRTGFDDFDDEEDDDDMDSYELDGSNISQTRDVSVRSFSEVENTSGSEDFDDFDGHANSNPGAKVYTSGSEDDDLSDHPQLKSSHVADSWRKSGRRGRKSPVSDVDFELGSDYDDEVDEGFGSRQRKNHQQRSGRKSVNRQGRGSDSDDDGLLLDSDSDVDDSDLYSGRNKMRGNKGQSDRGPSTFRRSSDSGNARRGEFRSDDRRSNRRNSFGNHNDDFSSRGSRGDDYGGRRGNGGFQRFDRSDEGNRRSGYGGGRDNERFQRFDGPGDGNRRSGYGRGRDNDRFQRFDGPGDGNRRNGHGGRRENDRFQRFDRPDDGNRRPERHDQFSDRSRGSRGDERGPRGNGSGGRGGGRGGDDGFRQERTNRFRDRSRGFSDD